MNQLEQMPTNEGEELSPTLQEIKNMPQNFNEDEYAKAARDERRVSKETSEDAFLTMAKKLIDGENTGTNTWGAMLRILERDSMKGHPNMELFIKATQELAEKNDKELKVAEGYWEGLNKTEEE
jgi:hypothetical protein